jgi:hypothetical protein
MNMFRNILTVAFFALGTALWFVPLEEWNWVNLLGGQAVMSLEFLFKAQPFSTLICLVVATALFMTRKQY